MRTGRPGLDGSDKQKHDEQPEGIGGQGRTSRRVSIDGTGSLYITPKWEHNTVVDQGFLVGGALTVFVKPYETRMHSSRMRTVRSSGCISGGVCLLLGGGVCFWGGCLFLGGVSIPACTEADTPSPPTPCGQTDACKNITFATSLRTVTKTKFGP